MDLTIQIVGWNSKPALGRLVPVLQKIPLDSAIVRYIDNASRDGSLQYVQEALPGADCIQLSENTGFSGGHNIGFNLCETEFVLVLNPDVEPVWENIGKLLAVFHDPAVAAVQGKLLRNTDAILDSAGITQTLSLNGKERGAGQKDIGQYDAPGELAATTGACSMYRMSALKKVAGAMYVVAGKPALEVFDKDFFAYKEDVDLGWRLRNAHMKVLYEPVMAGIHSRALRSEGVLGWRLSPQHVLTRLRSLKTKYSLRNYVWMIVKNASAKQLLIHEIFIDVRLGAFFILSLLYWPLLVVWLDIWRKMPLMMNKRYEARHHHG